MSPVFGFTTPFLARKGDGGMVETAAGHPQCGEIEANSDSSGLGKRQRRQAVPRPYAACRAAASVRPIRMLIVPIALSNDARICGFVTMTRAPLGSSTGGLISHIY